MNTVHVCVCWAKPTNKNSTRRFFNVRLRRVLAEEYGELLRIEIGNDPIHLQLLPSEADNLARKISTLGDQFGDELVFHTRLSGNIEMKLISMPYSDPTNASNGCRLAASAVCPDLSFYFEFDDLKHLGAMIEEIFWRQTAPEVV